MIKLKNIAAVLVVSSLTLVGCQSGGAEGETSDQDSTSEGMNTEESGDNTSADMMDEVQPKENVTDEELKKFSQAIVVVQTYAQQVQPRMYAVVQESGMTPQRYSEILRAEQAGIDTLELSANEQELFDETKTKLEAMQENVNDSMAIKIEETGLTENEYRAIMATVRQDTSLQSKLKEMQQEQMMNQAMGS